MSIEETREGERGSSFAKFLSIVFLQRVKINILYRLTKSFLSVLPSSSFRASNMHPVSSLITGAFKTITLYKGLHNCRLYIILFMPIFFQFPHALRKRIRSQILDFYVRNYQKPTIAYNPAKILYKYNTLRSMPQGSSHRTREFGIL